MRQRIPLYATAFLILAAAYLACLDEGWSGAATVVLVVTFLGIAAVAVVEHRVHERECSVPKHEGWRDGRHVRDTLHAPPVEPFTFTGNVYRGVVYFPAPASPSKPPTLEELLQPVTACVEDFQRAADQAVAELQARFDQAAADLRARFDAAAIEAKLPRHRLADEDAQELGVA